VSRFATHEDTRTLRDTKNPRVAAASRVSSCGQRAVMKNACTDEPFYSLEASVEVEFRGS